VGGTVPLLLSPLRQINGNGKCEFIQRNCHEVSNALSTLVARESIFCNYHKIVLLRFSKDLTAKMHYVQFQLALSLRPI